MFRDILVHVDASEDGKRRLAYAHTLAVRFEARLTGVHVLAPADPSPYKPSGIEGIAVTMEQQLQANAADAEDVFEAFRRTAGVPIRWRLGRGHMGHVVCDLARFADLVVVGQYEREGSALRHPLSLADEVVRGAAGPVVVAPRSVKEDLPGQIVVAWDGSAQSVRAVHDAMPFLASAREISLITVDDEVAAAGGARSSLDKLVDHLGQAGLDVGHINARVLEGHPTAMLARSLDHACDLLVIGAYSRPAWFEGLFGGTTLDLMRASPVPVLISH